MSKMGIKVRKDRRHFTEDLDKSDALEAFIGDIGEGSVNKSSQRTGPWERQMPIAVCASKVWRE
jgi:hypothetical protein